LIVQERKIDGTLMCIVCEQIVFEVRQLQREHWVRSKKEWSTRARQPVKDWEVRQLPIEDLCVEVRELHLGVKHLPTKDLCVGVRQLLADGCYSLELNNSK
jgi:hypothetical protein